MHAYLIIGKDEVAIEKKTTKIKDKLNAVLMKQGIKKIEDVRNLQRYVKLSLNEPTALLIKNIDKATTEALNAFLKNLEEPRKNISYILTATSTFSLIPTIVSRCQIISLQAAPKYDVNIINFLSLTTGEKLKEVEKMNNREEAKEWTQNLLTSVHRKLNNNSPMYSKTLKCAEKLYQNLTHNGNVNLQLTSFILSLDNPK
jgi:DNA polymerase III delta prime subunit